MTTFRAIDALLALALVVVVPSATSLLGRASGAKIVVVLAGAVGAASFVVGEGLVAASIVVPWLAVTAALGYRELRLLAGEPRDVQTRQWPRAAPALYLFVGACWLATSRYGARPLGFSHEIVELTAVHFHYAGFVAPLVTRRLAGWLEEAGSRHSGKAQLCEYAVLAATPITAAGITVSAAVGAVGAVLFALALAGASILTIGLVLPRVRGPVRYLLGTSSIAVVGAMVLGVSYALGRWLPTPAPSLKTMVWTHGLLNALGYSLCGVLGWTKVTELEGGAP